MNTHPLYNNLLDYRNYGSMPNLTARSATNFLDVTKPKPSFFSKISSSLSLGKVGAFLGGTQKVLNIYNQVTPIIRQTKPLIANIKTTLKVAKAFKRFSKEDSLEKAFDNLPDFEQQQKKEKDEKEKVIDVTETKTEMEYEYIDIHDRKEDKKIPNPYFNML